MPSHSNFAEILAGHPGLRPGVSEAELEAFEERHGITLPPVLREFYHYTDGMDIEDDESGIYALATPLLKHGCLYLLGTGDYDLWVRLEEPLQDYVWLQDLYSSDPIRYAFRNLATCLSAYRKSNGTGWPDWDEIPWELTTTEPTLEEAAHAEQLFTQWLQPNDDWEYLLGRLPYQRTADLHVALQ